LIRSASRGDRRSEEQLFAQLYKFIKGIVLKKCRTSLTAEEQEEVVFNSLEKLLALCRDSDRVEKVLSMGRFFGYAHVMAENTALDYYRKRHRRAKVFVPMDDSLGYGGTLPDGAIDNSDLSDGILGGMESSRLLQELDEKYRAVIVARMNGKEYEEISKELGVTASNARQIHKRGVRMLREKLIVQHSEILFSLDASHAGLLRRLYLKEQARPRGAKVPLTGNTLSEPTVAEEEILTEAAGPSEEEALQQFYIALMERGLFVFLIATMTSI
jgi:RNA polymerase sigma factor (sigma-70 family)